MGLLTDNVAIVTGAGQGLGRAVSLEFSDEGSTVALLERNPETLQEAAAEIKAKGGACEPYELDITDYDAYRSVVDDVISRFGKIDAIVNNAAVTLAYSTILEDSLEDWRRTIAINLEAVYMGSKLVAPHMAERGSGRIISIASVQGFAASGEVGPYNAAKGGIIALTKSMAVELGPSNILVTRRGRRGSCGRPCSISNGVDRRLELRRIFSSGTWKSSGYRCSAPLIPQDLAGTVVFLASKYCRYMTGQVIVVDGGLTSTF